MTKISHIVKVIVFNGEEEFQFETEDEAKEFVLEFNKSERMWMGENGKQYKVKALYLGAINNETGELV
jgi:hypothetical protein